MSKIFGGGKTRRYFEGWYCKQQNSQETVALIPAFHLGAAGVGAASLQVITDEAAWNIPFPDWAFRYDEKARLMSLGGCTFSPAGCRLDADSREVSLRGELRFGPLTPPAYDIMGPFCAVPFMECRHSVFSLLHRVDGTLTVNGRPYVFANGRGYMEGDRGVSFPRRYLWTQCTWEEGSVMVSVAEIPLGRLRFTGCIGFVFWEGKEHRIATYCGVRLLRLADDTIVLRQGRMTLSVKLLKANSQPLRAPDRGSMTRTIHESVSCVVQYTCQVGDRLLFDLISPQASFESHWRVDDEPTR